MEGASDDRTALGNYIAGFVDGEGSFHIAIQRNRTTRLEWQLVPEFQVSQHVSSGRVLELMRDTLCCGYIKFNHQGNPKDETCVYVVRSRRDLEARIIPFFQRFPLRTAKRRDFEVFASIVGGMARGEHKSIDGLIRLLELAFSMNKAGKYRRIALADIVIDLRSRHSVPAGFCTGSR